MTQSEFRFDKRTHTYRLGKRILPSVSEIMRPITEPSLSKVPPKRLEEARRRGNGVHDAVQSYILFQYIEPEWKDYVDQFIHFLDENHLQVVWNEKPLHNGEYAGTIDLLLKTPKNEYVLVDIKTTYAINWYVKVQLCAYKRLVEYNGVSVSRCYVLHLKADRYDYRVQKPDHETWERLLNERKNQSH